MMHPPPSSGNLLPPVLRATPDCLSEAARLLCAGGIAVIPTDTVYGIAAHPDRPEAVARLSAIKRRAEDKPIALLAADVGAVRAFGAHFPEGARRLADACWPGALTLVLPHKIDLPVQLSPYPGLAVRMPRHQLALQILERTGPLAVTSANLSAHSETLSAQDVYNQLTGRIPLILDDGSHPGGKASTVIDCMGAEPVLLRQGPIAFEDIVQKWKACGKDL